jgi:excisionase family DNA binding protein
MIDLEQLIADAVARELDRRGLKPANDAGDHLTVAQYAARLSISERTVRDAVKDGRLEHVRIGRAVRIPSGSTIGPRINAVTERARLTLLKGKR